MIVFKLERERPAHATSGGVLYYVKDRYLRSYDYASQRDTPLITVRPRWAPLPAASHLQHYMDAPSWMRSVMMLTRASTVGQGSRADSSCERHAF